MAQAHYGSNGYSPPSSGPVTHHGDTHDESEEEEFDDPLIHLASIEEKKRLWWRNGVVNLLFMASWFFFATILSLYNKWMFSPEHFGFPFPLFVTTIHMFVQFLLAGTLRLCWPAKFKPANRPSGGDYVKKAVPTGLATGLDIGLSNLSLKTITLSFYTMCKSSSLIFVLTFAFLFKLETFSWRLILVIALIFFGVLMMVATETHFMFSGFILVISASALGGLRWSLTQLLLKNKKMGMDNPAATIFWLALIMGISLCVISLILDKWMSLFETKFFESVEAGIKTVFFLIAPGVVAFCMVMSEFYIIQRVGVVPMSIAGIGKEVATITISAWFFGDELNPSNITGVAITTCGIGLFTYHKYRRSIDSTVPLDAHGNPLTNDSEDDLQGGVGNGRVSAVGSSTVYSDTDTDVEAARLLFSAEGNDRVNGGETDIVFKSSKYASLSDEDIQVAARESLDAERAWNGGAS